MLAGDVKSRSLKRAFGWDRPVSGLRLAQQLVSLSKKFEVRAFFFFDRLLVLRVVVVLTDSASLYWFQLGVCSLPYRWRERRRGKAR